MEMKKKKKEKRKKEKKEKRKKKSLIIVINVCFDVDLFPEQVNAFQERGLRTGSSLGLSL